MLRSKRLEGWTSLFLITTAATRVSGFLFPFHRLLPSRIVGLLSLVVLTATVFARYPRRLAGS
jgi:hypothetical protein